MKRTLAALLLVGASTSFVAAQLQVKVMTFNIHAGHDASLTQIAQLIKSECPDFVALQEVDCNTHRNNARHQNGRDFMAELAYHSGMMALYCPTITYSGGYYGIGLLTRHPYVAVQNIKLPNPNPEREQRGLLECMVVLPQGDTLVVACTHLEAFDAECRAAQGQYIMNRYAATNLPTIIAGDFNASPTDSMMATMMLPFWLDCTDAQFTFSTEKPEEKIDYIFARPRQQWHIDTTRVIGCALSDHFPVVSTITLDSH